MHSPLRSNGTGPGAGAVGGPLPRSPAMAPDGLNALTVSYDAVNAFLADYLQAIARGETFVPTERTVAVGTLLELRLEVPGTAPLALRARVTRGVREPLSVDSPAGVAVEFVFDGEGERGRVERRAETLLVEQLGFHHAAALLGRRARAEAFDHDR